MKNNLKQYTWDDVEIEEDDKISHNRSSFSITKADDEKRLVFGWALVSARSDGEKIIDSQGDIVEQDDLEEGAYEYVLNFRDAGEEHVGSLRKKARMVESVVLTEEKMRAMGIPPGTVPVGWWIGFYVDDDKTWELIKNGTYKMFSIEGKAVREPVKEPVTKNIAKAFSQLVEKFNPYHDSKGRFATAGGAASFTYKPGASRAHDLAIEREKQRHAESTPQKLKAKRPREATPRMQSIQKVEVKIKNQNFESAAIIDDDGNQLLFKDGQASQVGFSRLECMMMANNTMIHNHPRCNMFSHEDLECMVGNQIYETRVVNRDGTVYSMKRAAGGYSTEKAVEFIGAYKKEYTRGTMHAQRDLDSRGFQEKIWKGEISQAEANIEFGRSCASYMADWTAKTAPNYGLEFTIEQTSASASTMKSWSISTMKADDDYLILDRETNDLEDKAFNEWLEKHGLKKEVAKSFEELMKFNPYHDSRGRFTTAGSAASFTYKPGQGKMYDNAIAREKERVAAQEKEKENAPRKIVLDQKNKELANNWSFMRDKGGYYEKLANEELDNFRSKFKRDGLTDEQKKYLDQREEEYAKLVTDQYNDLLYREGTNPSAMVAGPANFNTRRFERKQQAEINSQNEYREKKERFIKNTEKGLEQKTPEDQQIARWRQGKWKHGETIASDDPLAEKKLQAKLEYQKEQHQKMKDANAYYRKNGTMQGFEGFSEKTNAAIDESMKQNSWHTKPFGYQLTNSNQQIKATESRLKQMQQQKATVSSSGGGGSSFNGGQIIRNTDMNRLQIKFDGIPDAATRQQLKSNGWRWSPKNGVWQRQLTANAEASAKRITDELNKSYDYEVAKSFSDIIKFNPYHDSKGRFATSSGYASFTFRTKDPAKQHMADMAVAREKEKYAASGASQKQQAEKRVAESESKLKTMLRDGAEVKLSGMDPDLAESTVNSVQMVLDRYPTVKDAFGGFTTDEPEPGYFTEHQGTYACYDPSTGKIHFNQSKYGDKDAFEANYQEALSKKHFPEGTTSESSVVHEMGHAIDRYLSLKTIDERRVRWDGETVSRRLWNNDIKNAKKKGEPLTGKSLRDGLSGYATKNPHEYFAEGFSEFMTSPNPRPMAQSIGKRMETYIKKAAKSG